MGRAAYMNLSVEIKKSNAARETVYSNLSASFADLVEVLSLLSERLNISRQPSLLETYERWQQNKSSSLYRRLEKEGIIPQPNNKKLAI